MPTAILAALGRSGRLGLLWLLRFSSRAPDAALERTFGAIPVQRALIAAMARSFVPEAADGFEGTIHYELLRPATGDEPTDWTLTVTGDHAVAREGPPSEGEPASVTLRIRVSDFVRVAAGAIDPAEPLIWSRATFVGDFGLAARLPEMFGAPRPR